MDEIKRELDQKFIYVRFCYWLANLENKEFVEELLSKIIPVLEKEDHSQYLDFIDELNPIIAQIDVKLYPKVDRDVIVHNILKNFKHYDSSFGIPYGHLNELFDLDKSDVYPSELPDHARLGFVNHSSTHMVEELILLEDSFIFFSEAVTYFDMYEKMMSEMLDDVPDLEKNRFYQLMTSIKKNVILKCKRGITSYYSFVEAFVNSIGYNFAKKNGNKLSKKDIAILEGFKNPKRKNYLSLNQKMMKFPRIIRNLTHPPLDLNSANSPEHVKFFFNTLTDLRNSLMHFSPNKASIVYKFDDWLQILVSTSQASLELTKDFWNACFPDKNYPEYLLELDFGLLSDVYLNELFQMQDFICLNIETYKERIDWN